MTVNSVILPVDRHDPVASTPCQSLRISYKDPRFHDQVTEEVFLDPRDPLLGENGLLLVNAAGITALQQKNDREHRWAESAQAAISSCRRDFLREQRYLLDELRRLQGLTHNAPKAVEKDIADLIEGAMKSAGSAAQDPSTVLSPAEVQFLAETMGGPRTDDDDELLDFLGKGGLGKEDDLTQRMLLQRIRADTKRLTKNRASLRVAVEALEGPPVKDGEEGLKTLVEELFNQAEKEEDDRKTIIDQLFQKAATPEQHKAIDDAVTKGLRTRFDALQAKFQELEPKVIRWRDQLETLKERTARHAKLKEEVEALEEQAEKGEEERRRQEAQEEREVKVMIAKAAAEARKRVLEKMPAPKEDNTEELLEKMGAESKAKLKEEQLQVTLNKRKAGRLTEELQELESSVEEWHEKKSALGARVATSESQAEVHRQAITESEEYQQRAEEMIRRASKDEAASKARREELEDELAAALAPPPKEKDSRQLEEEVEAAKLKKEELRMEEAELQERERQYEARFGSVESTWKVTEEEASAARLAAQQQNNERRAMMEARQRAADAAAEAARIHGVDPLLVDYKDRQFLPEYARVTRHELLHTDNRARDRRLSKTRRGVAEDQAERLMARMRSTESDEVAASSGPRSQVPVHFRRPEDLKVRIRGAERIVGHMAADLHERRAQGAKLAEDLDNLGRQLAASAAESSKIHSEIPRQLGHFLQGSGLPACSIRDQLVHALEEHQACTSRAEDVWRQAESGCTRGVPELELELEQEACARCEDLLTSAAQVLYNTSQQAARDGPEVVVPHARRCCEDWDAAEPRLTEAAAARGQAWPRILDVAAMLADARDVQAGLSKHIKWEERRRQLLDAERSAPPAARRALAAMRAATATTSHLRGELLE